MQLAIIKYDNGGYTLLDDEPVTPTKIAAVSNAPELVRALATHLGLTDSDFLTLTATKAITPEKLDQILDFISGNSEIDWDAEDAANVTHNVFDQEDGA